jgi:hypothetical protein
MSETAERDATIIADQERRIARLREEIELLEQRELELDELVDERFNPPDDDSTNAHDVIAAAATFIEEQRCVCGSFVLEDDEPCQRCRVLGRFHDKPVSR